MALPGHGSLYSDKGSRNTAWRYAPYGEQRGAAAPGGSPTREPYGVRYALFRS